MYPLCIARLLRLSCCAFQFYDVTTITYELEHAQSKQYILHICMVYLGILSRRGQRKVRFIVFVARIKHFEGSFHQY